MNRATIIGRLGADPELRHTTNGTAVCEMRIATNDRQKVAGEWQDATEWHRVIVWGTQGENAAKYLAKGSQVAVEGRIKTRSWESKDGGKRYTTEIVAQHVEYLGGKGDGGSRSVPQPADDDIPF